MEIDNSVFDAIIDIEVDEPLWRKEAKMLQDRVQNQQFQVSPIMGEFEHMKLRWELDKLKEALLKVVPPQRTWRQ